MSIEKQAESLLKAVTDLISCVTVMISGKPAASPEVLDTAGEKTTKKELAELKKAAKEKAGDVLKKLKKPKLIELLNLFNVTKLSGLKDDPTVLTDFIEKADKMLSGGVPESDDDLLGEGPTDKEYTTEDVKALLLKVNNAATLGKEITRQILADLGVARLGELKKEKFAEAVEKTEVILKDAGEA